MLAGQHRFDFGAFDVFFERVESPLQVAADVLALVGPFNQDPDIVQLLDDRVAQLEVVGEATAPLQDLLRLSLVLPEVGSRYPGLELVQFAGCIRRVKDSSAGLWRASPGFRSV